MQADELQIELNRYDSPELTLTHQPQATETAVIELIAPIPGLAKVNLGSASPAAQISGRAIQTNHVALYMVDSHTPVLDTIPGIWLVVPRRSIPLWVCPIE